MSGSARSTRVLIVDAAWWWREAVLRVLERSPRFEPEAAADHRTAKRLLRDFRPDVVIVDLDNSEGRAILDDLREHDVPAIAWGASLSHEHLVAALGAGASYVKKTDVDPERLTQLLVVVASGDTLLPQATRRVLSDLLRRRWETPEQKYQLTPREAEVLAHIAQGRTNAEIAKALHLAPSSVKKVVSRLMQRLGVRNRTEAALLAHLEGIASEVSEDPVGAEEACA